MLADPELIFEKGQVWRLLLSPLVVTSFWFDILLMMPLYLCFFCYTREFHTGTLATCLNFNLTNVAILCVSYLVCCLFALVAEPGEEGFFDKDSAFFSIFVSDMLQNMLANPNKPVDLLCVTVAQKYFIFVVLGLGHFVLPYAWSSVVAVFLVSLALHAIRRKRILNPGAT